MNKAKMAKKSNQVKPQKNQLNVSSSSQQIDPQAFAQYQQWLALMQMQGIPQMQ